MRMAMRIMCVGDEHITLTAPFKTRTDDYLGTLMGKMGWIYDLARKEGCTVVVAPGDMTDHFSLPNVVLREVIKFLRRYEEIYTLTVYGQHDLRHRRDKNKTALAVLEAAGVVTVLAEHKCFVDEEEQVAIQGMSYGDASMPRPNRGMRTNILVAHMMVAGREMWPGQRGYTRVSDIPKLARGYDLVVTGDNHETVIAEYKGGPVLVNCGSLMRLKTDQANHQPLVVIYDSGKKRVDVREIPIKPATECLALAEKQEAEGLKTMLKGFMETWKAGFEMDIDYLGNLKKASKSSKIIKPAKVVLREIIDTVAKKQKQA